MANVRVNSPNVKYTEEFIEAKYEYQTTKIESAEESGIVVSIFFY